MGDQADIWRYIQSNFTSDETGVMLYEFLAFSLAECIKVGEVYKRFLEFLCEG